MDDHFDLPSLAIYLGRPVEQVRRLAERGKLPGRRVGGQWRFDRAEIFHWLEAHIGSADPAGLRALEDLLAEGEGATPAIALADRLPAEAIWIGCGARTRTSLIRDFCELAARAGWIWDPETFSAAVLAREALHSTALENGVALLHPRRPLPQAIAEPFLALALTSSGIAFGGPRGTLTDVFFLIASASEPDHLQVLARLSRLICQPGYLDRLRQCVTPVEVQDWTRESETQLDQPSAPASRPGRSNP